MERPTPSGSDPPPFSVHLLPTMLDGLPLAGTTAVIIDLLRASTTITTALAAGADGVIPSATVDEARQLAEKFAAGEVLLGGERGGTMIEGFDLDNSPTAYTPERVGGKPIVFTTTNGTAAIAASAAADRILVGCFANFNTLVDLVIRDGRPVRLICAGTGGEISAEDVICAGAFAAALWKHHGRPEIEHDQTLLALAMWEAAGKTAQTLLRALRNSRGGRNLRRLGYDADIVTASRWDTHPLVPEFSPAENILRPAADVRTNCVHLAPPQE